MDTLSNTVRKSGADAFVMYASSRDADMRYLTQFVTSDPFVYFKKAGENGMIIVSQMETGRASRESTASVMTRTQAGLPEILKTEKDPWKATAKIDRRTGRGKNTGPPQFPGRTGKCTRRILHGGCRQRNGSNNTGNQEKGRNKSDEACPEGNRDCNGCGSFANPTLYGKKWDPA